MRTQENPYKVLVAGGCYSGLAAAINLLDKCDTIESPIPIQITIVDERDGFYHVIGSPLALAQQSYAEKAWVEYKDVKILQRPNVRFVHGSLTKVDPATKTATISERRSQVVLTEGYDFFIAATGLRRVWPVVPQALSRKAYLMEAGRHIDAVTKSTAPVLVVGGGAVGIEMAAELKEVQPHVRVTLAHSCSKLLSAEPLPDTVRDCALDLTRQAGVEVLLSHRLARSTLVHNAEGVEEYAVEFENGHTMTASQVVVAISKSVPSTAYLPRSAVCEEGYVKVLPSMQFLSPSSSSPSSSEQEIPNASSHFAVGDLIKWSGIKRCGAAMHEGKLAALNIHQLMLRDYSVDVDAAGEEPERRRREQDKPPKLHELDEIPPMIGLAVGKSAVSYGPEGMRHGPQVMKLFFEEDLGFRIVWDHLRLGGKKD
ncbi:FAD/NAD(P)-binding domain-containing protein [Xylariomycetidae sp. FL2044]|nr:FAD/NAD(P)-binding domain-containing protein [Xylariomycetidae sp. FL2044]